MNQILSESNNSLWSVWYDWGCRGTYKVRNEIETKRNQQKRNEMKTKQTKAKQNQRKQNEIDWYEENGRKKIKDKTK